MPEISRRARSLGTENAFVVLAEVNDLVRQGKDIISFCIGQPDFPAPQNVQEAGIRAIREGKHGYTPSAGIDELREAAAGYLARKFLCIIRNLNNAYINPAFGAFLCFDPVDTSLPPVQIVDRRLQMDWKQVIKGYKTVVQNYRMISDGKKMGWPQREEIYGSAAIGMDKDNHVLFILSRSPFSTHDLIQILLSLPIQIKSAMYVEGGPEATLYMRVHGKEMTFVGTCETDTAEGEAVKSVQRIPNVIGVMKRKGAANAGRD